MNTVSLLATSFVSKCPYITKYFMNGMLVTFLWDVNLEEIQENVGPQCNHFVQCILAGRQLGHMEQTCIKQDHYFRIIRKLVYTLTRNYFLQDLDEKRIKNIKNFMLSSVDVERKVFPIIMQCLDGMETAANSINEKEVILLFIYFMSNAITLLVFLVHWYLNKL